MSDQTNGGCNGYRVSNPNCVGQAPDYLPYHLKREENYNGYNMAISKKEQKVFFEKMPENGKQTNYSISYGK